MSDKQDTSEEEDAPTNDHSSVELTNTRDQSLILEVGQVPPESSNPDLVHRRDYLPALVQITGNQRAFQKLVEILARLERFACTSSSLVSIYTAPAQNEEDDGGVSTCNALDLWVVDAIVWGYSINRHEFTSIDPKLYPMYQRRLQLLANIFKEEVGFITDSLPLLESCFEGGCDPRTAKIGANLILDLGELCDFLMALSWRANLASEIFSGKSATDIPDHFGGVDISGFKQLLMKLSDSNFLELRSNFLEIDLAGSHNQEIPGQAVSKAVLHMLEAVKYHPSLLPVSPEQTSILDTSSL